MNDSNHSTIRSVGETTMRHRGFLVIALLVSLLMVSSCKQESNGTKYHPATVEDTDQADIKKVTFDARAAERIGLETAEITEIGGHRVVPYGALMYDKKGGTWVYTSPSPLSFVRQPVTVDHIEGEQVFLSDGPAAGTVIATVGAAELMGAEHGYGH